MRYGCFMVKACSIPRSFRVVPASWRDREQNNFVDFSLFK